LAGIRITEHSSTYKNDELFCCSKVFRIWKHLWSALVLTPKLLAMQTMQNKSKLVELSEASGCVQFGHDFDRHGVAMCCFVKNRTFSHGEQYHK
jgi:hypothetical protein